MVNNADPMSNLVSLLEREVASEGDASATIKKLHNCVLSASADELNKYVTGEALETFIRMACSQKDPETLLCAEDILHQVLKSVPADVFFEKFPTQILFGLNSDSTVVKYKFLQIMKKMIENNAGLANNFSGNGCHILVAAARCLADADATVAGEAQRFLIVTALTSLGLHLLFKQNDYFVVALRELLKERETVQFRCFEFISTLSQMSPQFFDECLKSGFIEKLLNELNSSDVLVKLNVLEVLTTMSIGGVHCLKHFHASGLLKKLYVLLDQSQSDPDATFLFPAVIKFFGHLAKVEPKGFNNEFPGFLKAVFHLVINYRLLEVSQRLLAFDSLGLVASTSDGKRILEKYESEMVPSMKAFGECIREGPMELRSRHIVALTNMFLVEPENLSNEQILSITESWMSWMKQGTIDDSITFLFDVLKRPIPEIRRTMCPLFKTLILLRWAQPKILGQEGFIDFIAAPLNERESEFNIFRHDIVGTILKSESISSTLREDQKQRLDKFIENGPYYKGISCVDFAMESA